MTLSLPHKVFLGMLSAAILIGASLLFIFEEDTRSLIDKNTSLEKVPSRVWMEYAQDIVREDEPAPPESARLYAFVSSAYAQTFDAGGSMYEASAVTRDILNALYPSYSTQTDATFSMAVGRNRGKEEEKELSPEAIEVREKLLERMKHDNFANTWDGVRPDGDEIWTGRDPLSPVAKTWLRFIVQSSDSIEVPAPPVWGSEEHQDALDVVKQAALLRTPQQDAAANFWGGVPGTEAPAGIWQNRLFNETREYNLTDEEYAYAQMVLALAVADAFMECWEVKYTYWTKRPSMDDPAISLGMDNPNFPSYVSGHSTISRAAAEVLIALFPEKRSRWMADAEEARDSRFWAGIHFPYDNTAGFDLGEVVGAIVVERLAVRPVR